MLTLWNAEVRFVLHFSPLEDWTVSDGNKENNGKDLLSVHSA